MQVGEARSCWCHGEVRVIFSSSSSFPLVRDFLPVLCPITVFQQFDSWTHSDEDEAEETRQQRNICSSFASVLEVMFSCHSSSTLMFIRAAYRSAVCFFSFCWSCLWSFVCSFGVCWLMCSAPPLPHWSFIFFLFAYRSAVCWLYVLLFSQMNSLSGISIFMCPSTSQGEITERRKLKRKEKKVQSPQRKEKKEQNKKAQESQQLTGKETAKTTR